MNHLSAEAAILEWHKKNPLVFKLKHEGSLFVLFDLFSLKTFSFDVKNIKNFRLMPHPGGFNDYLNLLSFDEKQWVLTHVGLAFAPSFKNTGFLEDAPSAINLTDYYQMYNHLVDLCAQKTDSVRTLRLFEILISVLDGAKEIGLDVGAEEESLDKLLTSYENFEK